MGGGGPSSGPGTSNPIKIFANIFIAFIGAGVLGLPYAFKEAGLLESVIIMSIVGFISVKAMLLLVDCKYCVLESRKKEENGYLLRNEDNYSETQIDDQDMQRNEEQLVTEIKYRIPKKVASDIDLSYGDLGYEAIGSMGRLLVDFAVVLSQIGFCCAYLIFITKNLSDFVPSVTMGEWLIIVLPPLAMLTFLRSLSSLAVTSIFAQLSNLFAFGVVFWFDFDHLHLVKVHPKEISIENMPFFFVIAIYCYEGAGLILTLESSLAKEVRHKFTKYFVSTMVIVTTLYILFGGAGYLSFGPETNQIITLNLPKGDGFNFSLVVKSCLCLALFCTYPVMMFPVMSILERYFLPDANKSMWKGNVMRGLVVLLTGMIVQVIPNFADLMALVGASCCTLLAFILPGLFHLNLFKGNLQRKEKMFDYLLIFLGVIGTVLGLWDAMSRMGKVDTDFELAPMSTEAAISVVGTELPHLPELPAAVLGVENASKIEAAADAVAEVVTGVTKAILQKLDQSGASRNVSSAISGAAAIVNDTASLLKTGTNGTGVS